MSALLHDTAVSETPAVRDRERLQGVWNFVTGRRKVQLFITGDHFTAKFANGDVYVGTFDLDPTRKPKAMDMTITEGPDKYKGVTTLCIYALDGDHLVWCPGAPGEPNRPKAFPPTDSDDNLCVVFRQGKGFRGMRGVSVGKRVEVRVSDASQKRSRQQRFSEASLRGS